MPTTTRAAVIRAAGVVELEDIHVEDPLPDEVLVRIESSGICRTDLEILERGDADAVFLEFFAESEREHAGEGARGPETVSYRGARSRTPMR
ncbi:hypothetical protein [Streptomyces sp. NPDC002346]